MTEKSIEIKNGYSTIFKITVECVDKAVLNKAFEDVKTVFQDNCDDIKEEGEE